MDEHDINPDEAPPLAIRLLNDPPLPGPMNMARDEALLAGVGAGTSPPTLRLYQWSEPTISLGYFQRFADYVSLSPPAGEMPVVRRLTGGGAILHDREVTYSLVLPAQRPVARQRASGKQEAASELHRLETGVTPDPFHISAFHVPRSTFDFRLSTFDFHHKPNTLYELVHDALIECLAEVKVVGHRGGFDDGSGAAKGPFFCFARRHRFDVLIGEDKVAGSAQRRRHEGILQHGSIILHRRYGQQPAAELCAFGVDGPALRRRLPTAVAARLNADIRDGTWTDRERHAAQILESKYASNDWTRRK